MHGRRYGFAILGPRGPVFATVGPMLLLVLGVLAILPTSVPLQSGEEAAARELERICDRAVSDSRPAAAQALSERLASSSGAAASYLKGCQKLAAKDWGAAGAEFERATKASPDVAVYHFWFGRATGEQAQRANVFRQAGLARRTKGEFEKAVEIDSAYIPAREGLLRYYLVAPGLFGGSIHKAREQAEAITRVNAYRGGLAQANVAIAAHDTATLIATHEALARQFPDSTVPLVSLASIHLSMHQWGQAWTAVDAAERLQPTRPQVRFMIGRAAAESGEQLDRGATALAAWLRDAPDASAPALAPGHYFAGVIAVRRGDKAAAQQSYERALTLDPKFQPAKDGLARVNK